MTIKNAANKMCFNIVPNELKDLKYVEQLLISKGKLIMHIYSGVEV